MNKGVRKKSMPERVCLHQISKFSQKPIRNQWWPGKFTGAYRNFVITLALIALKNDARFILANPDRTNTFESKYLIFLWKVIGLAVIGY